VFETYEFDLQLLTALLDDVDAKLTKLHATFWTKLKTSALDIAEYQAGFEAKALALSVTAPDFEAVVPTLAQIRSAIFGTPLSVRGADGGKLLEAFVRDWSAKEVKAVTGAIRRGVFEGQTNSDMVKAIRGTRAAGYKDGLLAVTDRQARAVVNTAVQHAATTARMEVAKRNADVVQSVQWLSTLDSHVCAICRSLDHKTFPIDKGPRPPIHINDRCTMLLVTESWAELSKTITRPAVVSGKVQHVPGGESYYDWLKSQPRSFVDTVLGVTRGKLFRDGGLSAKRFAELQLDRRFRPLDLEQMKALEPLAFQRAGL
jgi:SPP1 gp7 family putative phage head morphogenesis protein